MLKTQKPEPRKARASTLTSSLPDAALLDLLQPFESTLQRFDAALATHSEIEGEHLQTSGNSRRTDQDLAGRAMGLPGARAALDESHKAHTIIVDAATVIAASSLASLKLKARIASENGADVLQPLIQSSATY